MNQWFTHAQWYGSCACCVTATHRQYLTQAEVWSGLVVEVTQRLEDQLTSKQRSNMRQWSQLRSLLDSSQAQPSGSALSSQPRAARLAALARRLRDVAHALGSSAAVQWVQLWTPMQLSLAFAYNWRTRRCDLILRCFLPLLLVLAIVGVCMGVGIWELKEQARTAQASRPGSAPTPAKVNETASEWSKQPVSITVDPKRSEFESCKAQTLRASATQPCMLQLYWSLSYYAALRRVTAEQVNKGGMAAVAAAGIVTALLAGIVAGVTNCKQISDSIVQGRSFLQLKDHSDKLGYQHAVSDNFADTEAAAGCIACKARLQITGTFVNDPRLPG